MTAIAVGLATIICIALAIIVYGVFVIGDAADDWWSDMLIDEEDRGA